MGNPLVAVIIDNYNGYELTRECLRSFSLVPFDRYTHIVGDPELLAEGIMPFLIFF